MANKYWQPKASARAQVSTVTVSTFDASTTYILSVNGIEIAAADGITGTTETADALQAAWAASSHPYAEGITATAASGVVTLTGTAEIPFTVTSSVSGGTGTIGSVTTSTTATGPHTLDEPLNWDNETAPSNNDSLYFRENTRPICWGLDGLTTTGHTVFFEASFTGSVGLPGSTLATAADGTSPDANATEYRQRYLQLDIARLEIGGQVGLGNPGGAQRLMIDNDRAGASQTVVFSTSPSGSEAGKPPVRLLLANSGADVEIRSGFVGLAIDEPGETTTIGDCTIWSGGVYIGAGTTLTNIIHNGGNSRVRLNQATATSVTVNGGNLSIEGDQAITTLKVTGGTVDASSTGTITTVTHEGGTVDYAQGSEARTVSTHQLHAGATVRLNPDAVTITNFNEPTDSAVVSVARLNT